MSSLPIADAQYEMQAVYLRVAGPQVAFATMGWAGARRKEAS